MSNKRGSPEKVYRNPGAEEIFDKEFTPQEYKYQSRAMRKNLKSATARLIPSTTSR